MKLLLLRVMNIHVMAPFVSCTSTWTLIIAAKIFQIQTLRESRGFDDIVYSRVSARMAGYRNCDLQSQEAVSVASRRQHSSLRLLTLWSCYKIGSTPMREVVGQSGYYSPDGDVAVRVITTVAKAALLVDNMEYGGKYESFSLLGATKDGCKIF